MRAKRRCSWFEGKALFDRVLLYIKNGSDYSHMPDLNELAPLISLFAMVAAASSAISSAFIARSNWRKQRIDLPPIEHTWAINQYEQREDDVRGDYPRKNSTFFIPKVKIIGNEGYGIISVRPPWFYRWVIRLSIGRIELGSVWKAIKEPGLNGDEVIRPKRTQDKTALICSTLEKSITFALLGDPVKFRPRYFVLRIQKKGHPDLWYDIRIMLSTFSRENDTIEPQMFFVGGE